MSFTSFRAGMPGISMPGGTAPLGLSLLSLCARSDIIGIMSQKVVIERVQVRGAAPYLGMSATPDGQQAPCIRPTRTS